MLPNFKIYYKASIIKTYNSDIMIDIIDQWGETDIPEISLSVNTSKCM